MGTEEQLKKEKKEHCQTNKFNIVRSVSLSLSLPLLAIRLKLMTSGKTYMMRLVEALQHLPPYITMIDFLLLLQEVVKYLIPKLPHTLMSIPI